MLFLNAPDIAIRRVPSCSRTRGVLIIHSVFCNSCRETLKGGNLNHCYIYIIDEISTVCLWGFLKKTQNVHQDKTRFTENFELLLVQHTTLFETYVDYMLVPSNSMPKETCIFRPETSTCGYRSVPSTLLTSNVPRPILERLKYIYSG